MNQKKERWALNGSPLRRNAQYCLFYSNNNMSINHVVKDLVKDSFPKGESYTVEDALSVLKDRLNDLDSVKTENAHLRRQMADLVVEQGYLLRKDAQSQEDLSTMRSMGEPGMLQLKQLITDPAVNREFMRLASLAKSASMEAGALREEIRTLHFVSNDPKGPRSLIAQIKSLESKVKSLSAEAVESKASSLETSLKFAEGTVSELKKKNHSLEEKIQVLLHDKDTLEKELLSFRHPKQAKRPSSGDGGRRRGRGRGR